VAREHGSVRGWRAPRVPDRNGLRTGEEDDPWLSAPGFDRGSAGDREIRTSSAVGVHRHESLSWDNTGVLSGAAHERVGQTSGSQTGRKRARNTDNRSLIF